LSESNLHEIQHSMGPSKIINSNHKHMPVNNEHKSISSSSISDSYALQRRYGFNSRMLSEDVGDKHSPSNTTGIMLKLFEQDADVDELN